ncbi:hypothetical protein CPB83DRAFT_905891 [Crepidotus variabilis]|uniref:Uncharacterized protein n=1 Tax=Crepidotus variabilis TaxID=179855 RepID=A0A9P6JQL6_9AGAR|nr:hypothetical protein CPB83DRAFT_905891 [Crepidotus variabilis]
MSTKDHKPQPNNFRAMPIGPDGSFKCPDSTFRNLIEQDGNFEPEKDIASMCPLHVETSMWATRTLNVRKLKGHEDIISLSITSPRADEHGWPLAPVDKFPGATNDLLHGPVHLKDLSL